ncbi:hypothetical protein Pelo_4208 [Pelomyxa schiedti]|nr:hypothetical protein Pelo_4208 [Pelomyxa schiedti]
MGGAQAVDRCTPVFRTQPVVAESTAAIRVIQTPEATMHFDGGRLTRAEEHGAIEAKVSIIGSPGCGKTSLLFRLADNVFVDSCGQASYAADHDIPDSFQRTVHLTDINCSLQLWDLPGPGHTFSSLHYRNCLACLVVYDTKSLQSAEDIIVCVSDILRFCPSSCQVILVGNMKLGESSSEASAVIKRLEVTRGYPNFFVNTKTGLGIPELLVYITNTIADQFSEDNLSP